MMTQSECLARCKAAGETCKNSPAGCTCHALSAYQPTLAPDQPPLETAPGDLSEWHKEPEGTCWVCLATAFAAVLSAIFVIAAVANVVIELRKIWP